jgi:hypothetical protein
MAYSGPMKREWSADTEVEVAWVDEGAPHDATAKAIRTTPASHERTPTTGPLNQVAPDRIRQSTAGEWRTRWRWNPVTVALRAKDAISRAEATDRRSDGASLSWMASPKSLDDEPLTHRGWCYT